MRDYDSGIGRYVQADPVGSVLFGNMAFNNLGGVGLSHPEPARFLYRPIPQQNPLYAYVSGNPISKSDPSGLLEPPDGFPGSGNSAVCPLVAQSFLGFFPAIYPINPITFNVWLCVYDCNTKCPATEDKMITEIQWHIPPPLGCNKFIQRPPGM